MAAKNLVFNNEMSCHVWRQAENDVEQFMNEKHNFDQYSREVRKYKRLADDIQYHCQKVRVEMLVLTLQLLFNTH